MENQKNYKGEKGKLKCKSKPNDSQNRNQPEQTEKTIGEHLKNKKEVLRAI